MSKENVDIVRRCVDAMHAFMRGEQGDPIAQLVQDQLVDSDAEFLWHDNRTMPDLPQHLRGMSEFREFLEQLRNTWVDFAAEPIEFIETRDGGLLTVNRLTIQGRESGVPIELHYFQVWTIRDRKVRSVELFRHRADALEAAGLSE